MPYEFSSDYNPFLGALSTRLLKLSPPLLHRYLIRSAIDLGRREVEIWFKTSGCQYFIRGGCTMCNYGYSRRVTSQDMIASIAEAIVESDLKPEDKLLITPSGSMFDPSEVPPEAFVGIMQIIRDYETYSFKCETQARYVTCAKLEEYRKLLEDRHLYIVAALESSNAWIRRNCLNKDLPTQVFLDAIHAAKSTNVAFSTDILLGAPFLSERESIEDATASVKWVLSKGVDECYLFPVHVKIGTITHWLWEHGRFTPPSLWSLVEVLGRFGSQDLAKISVAWHKSYYVNQAIPSKKQQRIPFTCVKCYDRVIELLDQFVATRSREVIDLLQDLTCECRDSWWKRVNVTPEGSLPQRLRSDLQMMGREICGEEWQERNMELLSEMLESRQSDWS